MKKMLYTLCFFAMLASCKSLDKLVEQGKYDEAIYLATKRLSGKKNKKTKDIRSLEKAYAKVMQRDIDRIEFLKSEKRPENWDEIYQSYGKLQRRQDRIRPFLPLVSKDGYQADFKFVKLNDHIKNAADHAAAFHYDRAVRMLIDAREGDRLAARSAYHTFEKVEDYYYEYKDKRKLSKEAYELGTTRILVNVINEAPVIMPEAFGSTVMSVRVSDLNTLWKEFHTRELPNVRYDLFADLQILDLQISPGLETRDHWTEEKRIKDGWKYSKGKNGQFLLDTLGKKIKVDKFKKVKADIRKVTREKEAIIAGNLVYIDAFTGIQEQSRPINVRADFRDESFSYNGDKRALPTDVRNALSPPLPFPNEYDLTMEIAENLKILLKKELSDSTY